MNRLSFIDQIKISWVTGQICSFANKFIPNSTELIYKPKAASCRFLHCVKHIFFHSEFNSHVQRFSISKSHHLGICSLLCFIQTQPSVRNGLPEKVVIDKSGTNRAGLEYLNMLFLISGYFLLLAIEIVNLKYLNIIVEQSHRPIK